MSRENISEHEQIFTAYFFDIRFIMNAEKYFGTKNLYEILQLKRDSQIQDGKISAYSHLEFLE